MTGRTSYSPYFEVATEYVAVIPRGEFISSFGTVTRFYVEVSGQGEERPVPLGVVAEFTTLSGIASFPYQIFGTTSYTSGLTGATVYFSSTGG